jgi:hypothetical protein
MIRELWQAVSHGKQGRTKTRSQEAQEESSAEDQSASDLCREQADHRETLVGGCARPDSFSKGSDGRHGTRGLAGRTRRRSAPSSKSRSDGGACFKATVNRLRSLGPSIHGGTNKATQLNSDGLHVRAGPDAAFRDGGSATVPAECPSGRCRLPHCQRFAALPSAPTGQKRLLQVALRGLVVDEFEESECSSWATWIDSSAHLVHATRFSSASRRHRTIGIRTVYLTGPRGTVTLLWQYLFWQLASPNARNDRECGGYLLPGRRS